MSKRFLTYFILALVVFQSAAGIADAHQSHQSGVKHFTFDYHEHDDVETNQQLVSGAGDQERECHHCCHCHGHISPAVFVKALAFTFHKSSISTSVYSEKSPSQIVPPLLRPPIAHT